MLLELNETFNKHNRRMFLCLGRNRWTYSKSNLSIIKLTGWITHERMKLQTIWTFAVRNVCGVSLREAWEIFIYRQVLRESGRIHRARRHWESRVRGCLFFFILSSPTLLWASPLHLSDLLKAHIYWVFFAFECKLQAPHLQSRLFINSLKTGGENTMAALGFLCYGYHRLPGEGPASV